MTIMHQLADRVFSDIVPDPNAAMLIHNHLQKKKGALKDLSDRCSFLQSLQAHLNPLLPKTLKGRVKVANYISGTLTLHVESAHWATLLHFHQSSILAGLKTNRALNAARRIVIKTRPLVPEHIEEISNERPRLRSGQRSVEFLRSYARSSATDARVRRSLEHIAEYIERQHLEEKNFPKGKGGTNHR